MTRDDRIPVPTNGHRSPLEAGEAVPTAPAAEPARTAIDPGAPTVPRIAFTPGQLAVGFSILAGLGLLLVRSRRRGPRG